jgi:hypothetical protein
MRLLHYRLADCPATTTDPGSLTIEAFRILAHERNSPRELALYPIGQRRLDAPRLELEDRLRNGSADVDLLYQTLAPNPARLLKQAPKLELKHALVSTSLPVVKARVRAQEISLDAALGQCAL